MIEQTEPMPITGAMNVAEQVRIGRPYGEAPMRRALVGLADEVVSLRLELEQRRALMIEALDLGEDGYAGEPWTWDLVASYARKRVGTCRMALDTVKRRSAMLAAVLDFPEDTPWPRLLRRVRAYVDRVTTGGPTPAVDTAWANRDPGPPSTADPRRALCPGCGHTWYRHEETPAAPRCVQPVEVNHVNGVGSGFEQCGCTERRSA